MSSARIDLLVTGLIRVFYRLRMALSEQNLELLPDYEQRIEVLKALQFIDDNSTVLLKGRVACEVSSSLSQLSTLSRGLTELNRSILPTS